MPRKARKELSTTFLHAMVQGLNKEYIFNEEGEIRKYIEILQEKEKNMNLMIVAYCIMNNHAHFLIYSDEIKEVSKLMSKVNTKYAIYYNKKHNRCGYVFRNRYRVEEIYTQKHLLSCINYIHNNPVKAQMCKTKKEYKYSSYNDYINKSRFINDELIKKCFIENNIDYLDILKNDYESHNFIEYYEDKQNNKSINLILEKFSKEKNIDLDKIKGNKSYLKDLAFKLYMQTNITQKEIGELLGVGRLKIHRILKDEF